MQLSATEDIEGTQDTVFAILADFEMIERQAMRRGVEIKRTDSLPTPQVGMSWHASFSFRGKQRTADVNLVGYQPDDQLVFDGNTGGLQVLTTIDCVALSRGRTRINLVAELVPQTLSARLLVQSMKLAKGGLDSRFRKRVAGLAKDLETKVKRTA